MNSTSYGKLIVETYKGDRTLRTEVKNGFATISQKIKVVGLKTLANANYAVGNCYVTVNKGATVYVREELLHTQAWAKQQLESDAIEGQFMVIDPMYVEFINQ
jgi:hypothetical protein